MAPSSSATTTSVQVAVRIRPTTPQDAASIPARFQRTVIHAISNNAVSVDSTPAAQATGSIVGGMPAATSASTPAKKQSFVFDQVHGPETTQHQLFTSTAEPLISRFLEGFNCTILAYGQTSSGKTYSMTGIDLDADPTNPYNGMGIIPRSISTIFSRAHAMKEERGGSWSYSIKGSFIELYNEDLIDLLSMDGGAGREVHIREDKHGTIIWDGLREVNVRGASEVMSLIRQGTAIRRTNETDMNAQSSRSHAIFSLTLTQRKYAGSGLPPRSSTPNPTGRSPSRLARPVSTVSGSNRISSPTFGRPATPSFASAMGRGGLRPSSAMGHHSNDARPKSGDDDAGEWITIVSKFHFVDLAGSERLKRTAAVGERIKEGISINSGLLALGNVISALGDPSRAKTHTASHIPYRDSKLTRLLQDSLGGNAHTLMIACISPAEWNANETVNTLKYANRARNIKNRAVVTEKEEGWEDLEWLQNTVLRLRKDLKSLKEGGGGGGGTVSTRSSFAEPAEPEGASKRVLEQMMELQNNYEDLRAKFVDRTEELTRLRRELGERTRHSSAGSISGTAKYEEIVGPVIEEYEKTISAMEAELSLNRAALRHTNDLVEEKEEELTAVVERHAATELYVEELKSRVSKLTEREASTEAYIRDLEEKVKQHEDTSITSNESVADLKREISKHKESEGRIGEYVTDLETRLARADESILTLRATVEKLEEESDARREEALALQERLDGILRDGDAWRTDLEEREQRVRDLEQKMEAWEAKRKEASEVRTRLGGVVEEVQQARRSLEMDMATAAGIQRQISESSISTPSKEELNPLENQLKTLQETHAATLADLASVTGKYQDALKEISDLAGQINEIKLGSPSSRSESPERAFEGVVTTKKRVGLRPRELSDGQINIAARRHFFRSAASTENLHSRSQSQSQSLSQELYSARSRMQSSPNGNGHASRSPSSPRPNLSISLPIGPGHERSVASLEKEIMRLQEVLKEREAEIMTLESTLKTKEMERRQSVRSEHLKMNGNADQVDYSPQISKHIAAIRRSMEFRHRPPEARQDDEDEPLDRLNELMLSMAQKEATHREIVDELNDELSTVRRQHDDLLKLSRDQAHNMSTEIEVLRSDYDETHTQLENLRQRETELLTEREALEQSHAKFIQSLQVEHEEALRGKQAEVDSLLEQVQLKTANVEGLEKKLEDASDALIAAQKDHEEAFGKLKVEHEEALTKLKADVDATLASAKREHADALKKVKAEHEGALKSKDDEHSAVLQRTEEEYYGALSKLRSDHSEVMSKKEADFLAVIERMREEHASEIKMLEIAREGSLTESQSAQAELLKQLQAEHSSAIEKKEAAFVDDLRRAQEEHAVTVSKKQEDHTAIVERLKTKHAQKLTELEASKDNEIQILKDILVNTQQDLESSKAKWQQDSEVAVQKLKDEHASAVVKLNKSFEEEMARVNSDHGAALEQSAAALEDLRQTLLKEKTEEITHLKAEHQKVITELEQSLVAMQDQHTQDLENAHTQNEALLKQERENLARALEEMQEMHDKECQTFEKDRQLLSQEIASQKVELEEHSERFDSALRMHEVALREKDNGLDSLERKLETSRSESEGFQAELQKLRAELERVRADQEKALREEVSRRESLAQELERHRSLLGEAQSDLQKTKDHRDTLLGERTKQESIVRDLQVQLARTINVTVPETHANRPNSERNPSTFSRANGTKLPPLTPPPSVPPPPAPKAVPPVPVDVANSVSSTQSSNLRSSSSSRDSQLDSPLTSAGAMSASGSAVNGGPDPKLLAQLEEQTRIVEEQEVMIKTLNKQLTHCESDLQAHMDLVSTLETSLGDSEKNLRKARMQATEIARERDTLNQQIERLRTELEEARREVATVRRSIVEEKQSLEHKLDEERRAKERVRQQLDMRVEELSKRKSKFVCL